MSRDITPFALRMPPELRAKVEQAAKETRRSLNAEIVARLETTFRQGPTESPEDFGRRVRDAGFLEEADAARNWADRVSSPEHREELEMLLATILKMLSTPQH